MDNNIDIFEEIRYSYTALHMNLFFEYIIKIDNKMSKTLIKILDSKSNELNIDFDKKVYHLRKDYIKKWIETSLLKELNFWILWDMAIIHSFNYIICKFKELIDNNNKFNENMSNLLKDKKYSFETIYSIINLVRSISTHWSLSKNYQLKKKDFSKWKVYHEKKGIESLVINMNIVENLHDFSIFINISDIKEGVKFSKFFDWYKMLMFIELCMNIVFHYETQANNKE